MSKTPLIRRVHGGIFGLMILFVCVGCGTRHAVGGGLARGSTEIGGETNAALGPAISARLWVPDTPIRGLVAFDLQTFRVQNPVRDEHFRILYVLPELQARPAPFFLRAGLGPALYAWGGNDPAGDLGLGVCIGAAVGIDILRPAGRDWSLEAFFRGAAAEEVGSGLIGLNVFVYLR